MNLSLVGKTAIVCGSSQGIGKAAALEMAQLGANIVLVARNEEKLKTVVSELDDSQNQDHSFIAVDFSNPQGLKTKITDFASKNPIHILINNTGGPPAGMVKDAQLDEFTTAFSNHLICNHILVQAVVENMKTAGYGRIINVISTSVKAPLKGLGVSNTIRGAVANWSKTLAGELGQFNITVNNVLPGATNTIRLTSIIANKAKKQGVSEAEAKKGMENQVPMNRVAEPEEVANAIAFLASPAASYINGINLPVDGGRTICL